MTVATTPTTTRFIIPDGPTSINLVQLSVGIATGYLTTVPPYGPDVPFGTAIAISGSYSNRAQIGDNQITFDGIMPLSITVYEGEKRIGPESIVGPEEKINGLFRRIVEGIEKNTAKLTLVKSQLFIEMIR